MNEFRSIEYEVWFDPEHNLLKCILPMFPEGNVTVHVSFSELAEHIFIPITHKLRVYDNE